MIKYINNNSIATRNDCVPLVASVLLNYNSGPDLKISAPQLHAQKGINHILIIVDNFSSKESVDDISHWLNEWQPDNVSGSPLEVLDWINHNSSIAHQNGKVYLLKNYENKGYSAGNNVGIRFAEKLGCDAVLVANPDIQVSDNEYILKLYSAFMNDSDVMVAASAIINLSGANENPMVEMGFYDELLIPVKSFTRWIGLTHRLNAEMDTSVCEKVSGCCFLVRTLFMKQIGYMDEGTFLYCEEAILSAQIKRIGKKISYLPDVQAVHAHVSKYKGNRHRRTRAWLKSRAYYHRKYTSYGFIRRSLLRISHEFIYLQSVAMDFLDKIK